MDIFILTFMDSVYRPHAYRKDLGAFFKEEEAMAAAEEDAGHPLPWEEYSDLCPHSALRDGDKKGALYFTTRMRVQ